MDEYTQIILVITSIIISICLILGIVFMATGLHKIKNELKKRNEMMTKFNRPYLVWQRSGTKIEIRNLSGLPAVINSVQTDNQLDLSYLNNKIILGGQYFSYSITETKHFNVTTNYHYQDQQYSDESNI